MQVHTRNAFYHMPIYCGFCGQLVIPAEEALEEFSPTPCKHTLFIAHSEGIEFLADRSKDRLIKDGFTFGDEYGLISIYKDVDGEEEAIGVDDLIETMEFPDVLVVESVVGAPSGMTLSVGFAPVDGE